MAENTEVVVIGGYAGVMAANRLTQRDDLTVTLINPRPAFVERIRLHQLVDGSDDAVVEYQEVLAEGIRLMVGTAARSWPVATSRSPPRCGPAPRGLDGLKQPMEELSDSVGHRFGPPAWPAPPITGAKRRR